MARDTSRGSTRGKRMLVRFDSKAGSITMFGEVAARSLAFSA